ncbi:MAG: hypothetical protein JO247_22410 [Chloroflexi bacterium]|nr:hypothetical protein [Chloroflexota bacterium]
MPPADAAAELYALPLDQFTAARNELAARLKKAKQPREAEAIRKLPKPSLTAWALDQVARAEPALIERLIEAGEALRQAQQALVAGQNAAGFRAATDAQKAAIQKVVEAACKRLATDGHPVSKTTEDRLELTLRAASADPEQGDLLRRGVLAEDLNPAGFGGFDAAFGSFAAPPAPHGGAKPVPRKPAGEPSEPSSELLNARSEVADLKRHIEALRQQSADAEGEAAAARQGAHKAELAVNAARRALEDAERDAEAARQRQQAATEALNDLRQQIDEASDQLADAEQRLHTLRETLGS